MSKSNVVNIYPNPTTSKVYLQSSEEIKSVVIFDLSGKILLKTMNQVENSLDVSQLQKGMYFLKISVGNRLIIKKLSKI